MANLGGVFDSDQHDDIDGFDPIPAGWYNVAVTGSDINVTKAKTGKYINLEHTVLDGEYKGRKIWNMINHINPNPTAVEIAQKTLATLCRAVGKKAIADTQELHGVPILAKVKIVPASGDYPPKNGIVTYKAIKGEIAVPDFVKPKKKAPVQKQEVEEEPPSKSGGVPWD